MAEEKIGIVKHNLIPEHVLLSDKEKQKVLEKYNAKSGRLPKILLSDPAILHMNPKVGDVVKIIRKGYNDNESIFYRVVTYG